MDMGSPPRYAPVRLALTLEGAAITKGLSTAGAASQTFQSLELSSRLQFVMKDMGYQFPLYPTPEGETMDTFLYKRTMEGVANRYGCKASAKLRRKADKQVEKELALIAQRVNACEERISVETDASDRGRAPSLQLKFSGERWIDDRELGSCIHEKCGGTSMVNPNRRNDLETGNGWEV
jgi:hypothetical protein